MLFNQSVSRLAGGLAILTLTAGCQFFPNREAPPAEEPPMAAAPVEVPAAPENAIEAALAREASGGAAVQEAAPPPAPVMMPNAPRTYTVQAGDTLWGISTMYLRDPWLWPEIWHVNPTIENPHLIYPGDILTLAYSADGSPQVTVARGNVVRVSPLVRGTPIDGPISTIPYEAIRAFLGRPSLLSREDLKDAACIVGFRDLHIADGTGHDVYIKGLKDQDPGRYSVVRVAQPLEDPETGKVLGYMGLYAAGVRISETGKVTKGTLVESARESVIGDLVFAEEPQNAAVDIVPHAPPEGIDGQIVAVVDGVSLVGQYQVVAVNRGTKHGLESGHVLAISQQGEVVNDKLCNRYSNWWCRGRGDNVQLPSERAGTLLIFKTYERVSYGLVVNATAELRVADYVHGQ
jgi:LysM repeat protein